MPKPKKQMARMTDPEWRELLSTVKENLDWYFDGSNDEHVPTAKHWARRYLRLHGALDKLNAMRQAEKEATRGK